MESLLEMYCMYMHHVLDPRILQVINHKDDGELTSNRMLSSENLKTQNPYMITIQLEKISFTPTSLKFEFAVLTVVFNGQIP